MNHRTYGKTKNCKGCRYWSEMIAHCGADSGGQVVAMCLSLDGPKRTKYMAGFQACPNWASGHLGAVDEPGSGGNAYAEETTLSGSAS